MGTGEGGVDQDVHPGEAGRDRVGQAAYLGGLADVGGDGERGAPARLHLAGDRGEGLLGTGGQDEVGALAGQEGGERAAEPGTGAGDDRGLALQVHGRSVPSDWLGYCLRILRMKVLICVKRAVA